MSSCIRKLIAGFLTALALAACAPHYPADPHRTLTTVTGGTLEVGVSHNEPFTSVEGPVPAGSEAELARAFAETLDAEIAWTVGGEEELVGRLEHGQLDLLIGGLTQKTPWKNRVGLTRPYTRVVNEFGQTEKHVMAVRKGENAFLLELDRFLQSRGGQQ